MLLVIPQDSSIIFALINLQGINTWDPGDGNMGKQDEKLPFPAPGPSTSVSWPVKGRFQLDET